MSSPRSRTGLRRPGLSQDLFLKDIVNSQTDAVTAATPEAAQEPPQPQAAPGEVDVQLAGADEDVGEVRRQSNRRGGVIASNFSQDSVRSAGSRSSSKGGRSRGSSAGSAQGSQGRRSRGNSADSAKGMEQVAQDPLPREPSSPKRLPKRKGNMAVWFSGDLWKLNSTGRDPTDLMNWRRRYFTLVWDESLGLVLNYASEKEDCKQTLGCIIQGKEGAFKASLATLQTVDVKLDDRAIQRYENSIRTYDIAVHKRSLHDPCDMSVPTDMKQILVNGVDQDGASKILVLGWSATEAMASWRNVIENAVRHHFKVELPVEHMQACFVDASLVGFAGTDSMPMGDSSIPLAGRHTLT